jgi:hypothetical protein
MQGLGILMQCSLLTLLLVLFGVTEDNDDDDESNAAALLQIWQCTYGLGAALLVAVFLGRVLYLPESHVWQVDKAAREVAAAHAKVAALLSHVAQVAEAAVPPLPRSPQSDVSALSAPSLMADGAYFPDSSLSDESSPSLPCNTKNESVTVLLLRHYGMRLVGVSTCWFLWDVAFYGNKLFQASFLVALWGSNDDDDDGALLTLPQLSAAATLNAAVAYAGYLAAAVVVDRVGRRQLQLYGFLGTGLLFLCMGLLYPVLSAPTMGLLYLLSSFVGQLGPNATTFCLPAEVFPTQVRTTCHGWAAAAGKAGAMVAALVFPLVQSELDLFLLAGYASLAACAVTYWTIPETSGLDLPELDVLWGLILTGRPQDYRGPATQATFFSHYERHYHHHHHRGSKRQSQQLASEQHYNHAMDDF